MESQTGSNYSLAEQVYGKGQESQSALHLSVLANIYWLVLPAEPGPLWIWYACVMDIQSKHGRRNESHGGDHSSCGDHHRQAPPPRLDDQASLQTVGLFMISVILSDSNPVS